MNFVGKFDAKLPDGTGALHFAHSHVDASQAHAPADSIIVPDAKLLFEGEFRQSGVDLILSKDGLETVVHDYFKGEKRVALSSPDGAHLTGDIVNALAGHVQYAQAAGGVAAAAAVVGHVTKLMGSATAIRNGVSIILNQGDNIEKGDVLQSGADSTLGVTFIDGTVFGLSSNARMVVNEMVYDPNGSSNSSLLSLVAGTISFVAGETAKHGDMKVDTPVATMGIRGTAVLVEIDFGVPGANGAPSANFQVLVEPDGTTGSYILFDKTTLTPLATVNAAGTLTKISQGVVSFQSGTGLTPEEQKLITDVFQQKFTDNSNPKSLDHQFTDSLTPQSLTPIKLLDGLMVTPVVVVVQGSGSVSQTSNLGAAGIQHIPGPPAVATAGDIFNEHIGTTGSSTLDTVTGKISFADINAGDRPSVAVNFASFTYQDATHTDISQHLTPTELAAVKAVEAISLQVDPGNTNIGSATWIYSYPDDAFDFLGAGETLTLTYVAAVNNNFLQSPETGVKTFTITITGTNDQPVITSNAPQTIVFNGGTSVPGGDLVAHVPTSGTITFDDPDLTDTHSVSVELMLDGLDLPPAPLEIFEHALTASIATDSTGTGFGKINWSLANLPVYLGDFVPEGQTITLTYAVTVTDSQGATSTQNITVTITGTDSPAVVWIATSDTGSAPGELLWSNGANWETGTVPTINDDAIVITNQLIGLTPSFPVTIDAPAEAKSLTMNDFGTTPPVVINQSTLTIADGLNMAADSIIHNSGTISVGGLIEVAGTSLLDNSGILRLAGGGDLDGQSVITNTGSIELSGGILNVQVDIANSGQDEDSAGGQITIDGGAVLALGAANIIGGTVTNDGTLTLDGGNVDSDGTPVTSLSTLKNGTLNNNGALTVGSGGVLRSESVANRGTIEVLALGALLLAQDTAIDNNSGTIVIDGTGTLTLDDASIDGGVVNNFSAAGTGAIDVTGSSTISHVQLNQGQVTVELGQTLTLDGTEAIGATIVNHGVVNIDASAAIKFNGVALSGGTITDSGSIEIDGSSSIDNAALANNQLTVDSGKTLTLDDTTITGGVINNTNGTLQVDAGQTLTLKGVEINDGTIDDSGTVDVETAAATLLHGVTVTGSGNLHLGAGDNLTLVDVAVSVGGGVTIGAGALVQTDGNVTLTNTAVTNDGTIEVHDGTLTIAGGSVASDAGHSGSIQLDFGTVLDLEGSDSQNVVFNGGNAELKIGTSSFGGTISGLGASDEIDLSTIGYGPGTTATYSGGVLTLTDGSHSISMTLTGDLSGLYFAGSSDGHGGTLITLKSSDDAPVFAPADKAEAATVSASDPAPAASGTLHFTDIDLTDRPTASVALSVNWANGSTDLTSSLTQAEISALEHAFSLSQSGNTNNGTLGWTYQISDNALDFLTAGETATVTATITLDDHHGGTDTAAVTVTLDGAAGAPVAAPVVTENLAHDTGLSADDLVTSNDALTGTGLANAVVHFTVDGTPINATTTADAQGNWSFTPTGLADGPHTVLASETDNLGNTGSAARSFMLDTTAPVVTIASPGVATGGATQTIHGTVADLTAAGTTVTIYDSSTSGGSISALGSSLLTAGHDLVNGMGGATGFGTQILAAGDDNSSSAIDITSVFGSAGVDFFGHNYTSIYLNNNGNITFAAPSGTYTPSSIDGGVNNPIIAPFWADVDTRGGAAAVTPGGNSTGANQVIYNLDAANGVLTITWDDVGYYSAATDKLDAFQVQLISLGNGNFDIVYRYENINWTTGAASGGSDGLGGTPARAGYSAGDGTNYYELPQSGDQSALLSLPTIAGNTGIPGVDVFQVVNGVVGTPTVTAIGTAIVQSDGTWSTDVTLANGTNSLTAQDTDRAGNSGTSAPVTYTVDGSETDSAAAFQSFAAMEAQAPHWTNAASGDFAAASNWSNDATPAVADDAVITATGTYTVTSTANESVHSIDLGTNVTLDIGGGTFTISDGGENDGLLKVEHAGSVLSVGGTVTNTGTIEAFDEAAQNAAPATVALNDGHITGGVVEAIAGGEISAASGSNSIDATVTIDANSSFVVDHGATVTVNASSSALTTTNDGVIEVQSGGNAVWAGALSGTGAIHIDNGASFELSSASSAGGQTVTFEGSTGSLTLDHPQSFAGTISGFTGDGTLSGSDQIDLKGIDYNSHSFSESFDAATDTLSVTDGTHSADLHFNGSYQAANFNFTTDNNGGTIVYDPPVPDNSAAKPSAVTANDSGFVFHFADHDQGSNGAHPATDTHSLDGQTFVNADADPSKSHDDGHGHAPPVPESMDPATVAAVKAQLHAHDFHFA